MRIIDRHFALFTIGNLEASSLTTRKDRWTNSTSPRNTLPPTTTATSYRRECHPWAASVDRTTSPQRARKRTSPTSARTRRGPEAACTGARSMTRVVPRILILPEATFSLRARWRLVARRGSNYTFSCSRGVGVASKVGRRYTDSDDVANIPWFDLPFNSNVFFLLLRKPVPSQFRRVFLSLPSRGSQTWPSLVVVCLDMLIDGCMA